MDLKTSRAMLNLHVRDAGLIQVYTLNYYTITCVHTKYQQEFIIVYPTPLQTPDTYCL